MSSDLTYRVSSKEILELVSGLRTGRLTKSPYFQRNLVWRDTHKREFIETILMGLPFPQIFLARGKINVATMESYNCVVDGQQRLTSIEEYVDNQLLVQGQHFKDLSPEEQEAFLKYQVAVIDFDLDESDERLKDVFTRLNRTYYSLSNVEKIATEFSGSEFLIAARVLCGDFWSAEDEDDVVDAENPFLLDPSIRSQTIEWARSVSVERFSSLIQSDLVFSNYEASRKVPLMFVLSILATEVFGSYFNRTEKIREYLEFYNANFPDRDRIVSTAEKAATFITSLGLKKGSFWLRKANFFTMVVELISLGAAEIEKLDAAAVKARLANFAANTPDAYSLAQREGVNNKKQRAERADYFTEYVLEGDEAVLTKGTRMTQLIADLITPT